MYFGMFGSIFFMSQYMQTVLGNSPLQAGIKLLVWTGATMVVAPARRLLLRAVRQPPVHGRRPLAAGDRARLARVDRRSDDELLEHARSRSSSAEAAWGSSSLPAANAVLASVRTDQAGQASGAMNAIRELGGVLGIAVLATVFTSHGSYLSPAGIRRRARAGDVGGNGGPRGGRARAARPSIRHPRGGRADGRHRGPGRVMSRGPLSRRHGVRAGVVRCCGDAAFTRITS